MVIETGAIQTLGWGFLFAFYNNYGAILYRLWDIASDLLVENPQIYIRHLYLVPP